MAVIPQEEINYIRQKANIVDVISSYIPLDHKGKNYFGVCPFHEDHSPSMSVSEEKQIYKCFSCGAAGNVFSFVQNYENISFIEAVTLIGQRVGVNLSSDISYKKEDKNEKYYKIMDIAQMFFQNNLKTTYGKNAIDYLNKRKISKEIIEEFGIGLSLPKKDYLYQVLKSKNISDKDMQDLALVNFSNHPYDIFTNRIMFPLHDSNGKIIGFSGRIYNNESEAKYLNTRETIIFKKGHLLFNYHRAKKYVRNKKSVILVEGYMDAIRMYSSGIKNVMAIMGTSLTKDQISLLRKLNSKIILCLDSDDPGRKAMYDIGQMLKNANLEVEIVCLSKAKDPDEYISSFGIDAFINNLKSPMSYLDYSLTYLKTNKNLNESVELANYINEVLEKMSKENDTVLINITLQKLAQDYNLEYEVLNDKLFELKKQEKEIINVEIVKNKKSEKKNSKYDKAIKAVLYYMMNASKYVRIFRNNLVFLDNINYREIAKSIIYYYEINKDINIADYLTYVSCNEKYYQLVLEIVSLKIEELNEDAFNDYLQTIRVCNEKKTIDELKKSLKEELDKNKKVEIAMKIAQIKKGSV